MNELINPNYEFSDNDRHSEEDQFSLHAILVDQLKKQHHRLANPEDINQLSENFTITDLIGELADGQIPYERSEPKDQLAQLYSALANDDEKAQLEELIVRCYAYKVNSETLRKVETKMKGFMIVAALAILFMVAELALDDAVGGDITLGVSSIIFLVSALGASLYNNSVSDIKVYIEKIEPEIKGYVELLDLAYSKKEGSEDDSDFKEIVEEMSQLGQFAAEQRKVRKKRENHQSYLAKLEAQAKRNYYPD